MDEANERLLLRLLTGELPPAEKRELERRLERDDDLARRWRSLQRTWEILTPPVARPAPADLRGRVAAAVRGANRESLSWAAAPVWVRAAAAAALVVGIAVGAALGTSERPTTASSGLLDQTTLAESFYQEILTPATGTGEGGVER